MDNVNIYQHGGVDFGTLWVIGWLLTIGYLNLSFRKGVLAIIIWPYYLGVKYREKGH